MIAAGPLVGALLDPDAEQARELLQRELSDPRYRAAQPSWFDLLAQTVADWLSSLGAPTGDGTSLAAVVGVVVIAAVVVVALLVTGLPRLRRRSRVAGSVLDADDQRSAAMIRGAAEAAAARGAWDEAVTEAFRAIARSLAERTIVTASPGTTAHGIAERAATALATEASGLRAAASDFDRVRYLGGHGEEADYRRIVALDERLRVLRPELVAS